MCGGGHRRWEFFKYPNDFCQIRAGGVTAKVLKMGKKWVPSLPDQGDFKVDEGVIGKSRGSRIRSRNAQTVGGTVQKLCVWGLVCGGGGGYVGGVFWGGGGVWCGALGGVWGGVVVLGGGGVLGLSGRGRSTMGEKKILGKERRKALSNKVSWGGGFDPLATPEVSRGPVR